MIYSKPLVFLHKKELVMNIPHGFGPEAKFDDLMMPHPSTPAGKLLTQEKHALMAAEWAEAEGMGDLRPLEDMAGYPRSLKIAAE